MKSILLIKKFGRLVELTFGLVNASFSLPEWQAVRMTFFAPCIYTHTQTTHLSNHKHAIIQFIYYTGSAYSKLCLSLFYKCRGNFQKEKKKKLNKVLTKSTCVITFVKEENKQITRSTCPLAFAYKLLFLVQINFSISYLLLTLTIKLSVCRKFQNLVGNVERRH